MRNVLILLLLVSAACRPVAPVTTPPFDPGHVEAARAVMQREDVARALAFVDGDRDRIVAQWRQMTEIPAPSGHEAQRAALVEQLLREYGLEVQRDAAGNVMATRRGTGGGRHVVFDAHLDTVFPLDTNVTTRIENGHLFAPGVGDDTRNVIALLAMIRAMNDARIETKGDVTFLFTVEEETSFRGIDEYLKNHRATVDRFVALDGGYRGFTYGGVGTYWLRYHIIGPGGHTRSDAPPYSATLPLARAIERIYRLHVPDNAWLNVGMLGAGDVFNAKARDAWMSVDVRSTDPATLSRLDREIGQIVRAEAAREGMTVKVDVVSREEVATLPGHRQSEMIRQTEGVWRAFGFDPPITNTASNHSSAALRAGVQAISTGVSPCGGAHGLEENCEIEPIFGGIKRNIVLAVVLSE